MVNNEERRAKIKLKLFEIEGFNWVLGDLMNDMASFDLTNEDIEYAIKNLKERYMKEIKDIQSNQQKLFNE